jgi:hypothetical protein
MRRSLPCVLALLALAVTVAPAQARKRRHKQLPATCAAGSSPFKSASQPRRQTVAADAVAQVYRLGGLRVPTKIYGCAYGHRGAYKLGVVPFREGDKYMIQEIYSGDTNFVLAGSIVAYEHFWIAFEGHPKWGVTVRDLRTGRVLRDEPTGTAVNPGPEPEQNFGIGHTTAIVVKTDGSVAWIVEAGKEDGRYQVHAADALGSRVLATGPDIDPTSLAVGEDTLYWQQGGRAYSAALN